MSFKYTVELSNDLNDTLEEMTENFIRTKSEVFRKALTLIGVAISAKSEGKHFGVAVAREKLETEIIGL